MEKNKVILKGFKIQKNVINALIYRELKTRVSLSFFGIIGVYIEPLITIAIFVIFLGLIKGRSTGSEIDIYSFLASGIITWTLYSSISIRSLNGIKANRELFNYRYVKPIDIVLARSIIEFCLNTALFIIFISLLIIFDRNININNINLIFYNFLYIGILSTGFGFIFIVLGYLYPILNTVIPMCIRPMFYSSGIFFSVASLPPNLKKYILWNPIVHAIEKIRYGISENYIVDEGISTIYLAKITISVICIGFIFCVLNQNKLLEK